MRLHLPTAISTTVRSTDARWADRAMGRRQSRGVRPLRKSIDRVTVAATKRSSFGAAMNRAVASSGVDELQSQRLLGRRHAHLHRVGVHDERRRPVEQRLVLERPAVLGQVRRPRFDSARSATPTCHSWRPVQFAEERRPQHETDQVGCRRPGGDVPARCVGVRQSVGDVEPTEVVVEVELAGRVVAEQPLAHRDRHDVEHGVERCAAGDRGPGRERRLGPVVAEQRGEQPPVVRPTTDRGARAHSARCRRSSCAVPRWNSFMYGNLSSRVP